MRKLPWALAMLTLLLHVLGNAHYGFFRDELYFIVCGRHPDIGYVDQPPLAPLLAAISQGFGASLFALRFVPALCAAAAVYFGCLFTEEIGGGSFAQVLAAICIALAPVLASFGTKMSTDTLDVPLWTLAALFTARALDRPEPRAWIGAGLAIGLSFNSKYSVVFFVFALVAGILVSNRRRALLTPGFAWGAAVAVACCVPNAVWQIAHGLPMLELLRNGASGKNVVLSPVAFLAHQLFILNPVLSIVWIAGTVWAFAKPSLRWIAWTFVILIALMIALHAKDYYPAAIYPIVFAAGACAIESRTRRATWPRPLIVAGALACGAATIPLAMPVLPIETFVAYQRALHLVPASGEHMALGVLPQDYADMEGWPEMTDAVARVYDALPARDRARTSIYTANYGEAAALDFFGTSRGLPPATSHHNQYYLWGTRGYDRNDAIVISINVGVRDMQHSFAHVRLADEYAGAPLAIPLERDDPIVLSRDLKRPLHEAWPFTKKLYY